MTEERANEVFSELLWAINDRMERLYNAVQKESRKVASVHFDPLIVFEGEGSRILWPYERPQCGWDKCDGAVYWMDDLDCNGGYIRLTRSTEDCGRVQNDDGAREILIEICLYQPAEVLKFVQGIDRCIQHLQEFVAEKVRRTEEERDRKRRAREDALLPGNVSDILGAIAGTSGQTPPKRRISGRVLEV